MVPDDQAIDTTVGCGVFPQLAIYQLARSSRLRSRALTR